MTTEGGDGQGWGGGGNFNFILSFPLCWFSNFEINLTGSGGIDRCMTLGGIIGFLELAYNGWDSSLGVTGSKEHVG